MGSKFFLYINAIVILFIIYKIIAGRKGSRPTPLTAGEPKALTDPETQRNFEPPPPRDFGAETDPRFANPGNERSLNCTFVFNAHTFDAFEVLGLPSGSSRDACLRAAIDLKNRGAQRDDFFRALTAAIEKLS